jgi:hypothetical protein
VPHLLCGHFPNHLIVRQALPGGGEGGSAAREHQIQQLADPETAVVGEANPDDVHLD